MDLLLKLDFKPKINPTFIKKSAFSKNTQSEDHRMS